MLSNMLDVVRSRRFRKHRLHPRSITALARHFLVPFAQNDRGTIAVVFALTLTVAMLLTGGAIDYGRAFGVQARIQSALDATSLAAARAWQINPNMTATRQVATTFFTANAPTDVTSSITSLTVDTTTRMITLLASATVPMPFLSIGGMPSVSINARSVAQAQTGSNSDTNLEISLVLDLSGSMVGNKIDDLKDAAKDLVDILVWDNQPSSYSKVAIVPYSQAVNVGTYADQVRGPIGSGTATTPGKQYLQFQNMLGQTTTQGISTCVTERSGSEKYTDAPPTAALLGPNYPGPQNPCLGSKIVPLSKDKTALKSAIDALVATGSTGGQIGVAWGWYLLSPNFAYLWPAAAKPGAYHLTSVRKIAVLMTDGDYNSVYCKGVIAKDSLTGSGASQEKINCVSPNGNSYDQAAQLCTNMKAAGIELYTIGFQIVNSPSALTLLKGCATDLSHFYDAGNGDALKNAFRDIAIKISPMRLVQ